MRRAAQLAGLVALCAVVVGCLGAPETSQLRALNDDLQRRNAALAADKIRLERELERLKAENAKLRRGREGTGEKTP